MPGLPLLMVVSPLPLALTFWVQEVVVVASSRQNLRKKRVVAEVVVWEVPHDLSVHGVLPP